MDNQLRNLLRLLWVLGRTLPDSLTLRQLAKEAGIPYPTAYRAVKRHASLFSIQRKGNLRLCSLNVGDPLIKHYLVIAERQEADDALRKDQKLSLIRAELSGGEYSCILFGSRADSTQREKSDIDLCIINTDGSKNVSFSKYELLFKLDINPIYLKKTEFQQMLEEKQRNLSHEIIGKHIILHGEECFWDIVYPWASR